MLLYMCDESVLFLLKSVRIIIAVWVIYSLGFMNFPPPPDGLGGALLFVVGFLD